MKIIGLTESGTIIVEVTQSKLSEFIALNSIAELSEKEDLYKWSSEFQGRITELPINQRLKNILLRAVYVYEEKYDEKSNSISCAPYIYSERCFRLEGKLLNFDAWGLAVIDQEINRELIEGMRMMGKKSYDDLVVALAQNLVDAESVD